MATTSGRSDVDRYFAQTPAKLTRMLRGAARAGANVIADEARARCNSDELRPAIKVATRKGDGTVSGLVQVKGPGAYLGPWDEYGTAPHLISVDETQRGGRSIGRINRIAKESGSSHSLVIGGNFVGSTVLHPGARPHPFMRPALDLKGGAAVQAAQQFIDTHGVNVPDQEDDVA